jgi:hydrogenase maturation protein HypF
MMRRARGYVPGPVRLSLALPTVLGCGAELKNTFCLIRGKEAFLSQHIGDLKNNENLVFFEESVDHLQDILEIKPNTAVRDLHPDYLSSRFAAETGLPVRRVQHHHAHAVAVMAEHGLEQEVLAVILDGSGYGTDNTLWGGEFLLAGLGSFKRLGHFSRLMLPGGDKAAQQPWRMGLSALYDAFGPDKFQNGLPDLLSRIPAEKRRIVVEMMEAGFNSPLTSSCGRLFDAVAALLGLRLESDYEGQAAMELEALALQAVQDGLSGPEWDFSFPVQIAQEQDHLVLQISPMITGLVDALSAGSDPALLALAFHQWLIAAIRDMIGRLIGQLGRKKVVLGGGCMQNALLLQGLENGLTQDGFEVFSGEMVPVNDGGVSLGQAVIGGLQMLK